MKFTFYTDVENKVIVVFNTD